MKPSRLARSDASKARLLALTCEEFRGYSLCQPVLSQQTCAIGDAPFVRGREAALVIDVFTGGRLRQRINQGMPAMNIIEQLEKEQAEKIAAKRPIPDFRP